MFQKVYGDRSGPAGCRLRKQVPAQLRRTEHGLSSPQQASPARPGCESGAGRRSNGAAGWKIRAPRFAPTLTDRIRKQKFPPLEWKSGNVSLRHVKRTPLPGMDHRMRLCCVHPARFTSFRLFREVGVSNGSLNERLVPADSQSRRDCVLQPRVARNELPWEIVQTASQPQRCCGRARHPRTQFRWGWLALPRCTQGSSSALSRQGYQYGGGAL